MRGPRWFVLASCSVAMMFASFAVKAGGGGTIDSGTIRFVGAIVEQTCGIATIEGALNLAASATRMHQPPLQSCSGSLAVTANISRRPYTVDVMHLSGSESDQVLRYFAHYVRAARPGSADPVLVTQIYE